MKKIFLLLFLSLLANNLFAQFSNYKSGTSISDKSVRYGLVLGMNSSTYDNSLYSSRIGLQAGAKAEFSLENIGHGIYLDAALLFAEKGAKLDMGVLGDVSVKAYYLELPVSIGYKYIINEKFSIFCKGGLWFEYGLTGKTSASSVFDDLVNNVYEDNTNDSEDNYSTDPFKYDIKRFDCGWAISAGAELNKKIQGTIGLEYGLTNVNKEEGLSLKNRNLYLSIAYLF